MIHVRQQIRENIATILLESPIKWITVQKTRIQSQRQIWPYLMVFSTGDTDEKVSVDEPCIYQRTIPIIIIGMLKMPGNGDTQTIEDKMDDLSFEVESKLTNEKLKALVPQVQMLSLVSTALEVIVTEDDVIDHAEVTMNWQVVCFNSEADPSTLI